MHIESGTDDASRSDVCQPQRTLDGRGGKFAREHEGAALAVEHRSGDILLDKCVDDGYRRPVRHIAGDELCRESDRVGVEREMWHLASIVNMFVAPRERDRSSGLEFRPGSQRVLRDTHLLQ